MAYVQKVSANADSVSSITPGLTGVTAGNTLALIVGSTDTTSGVASWSPPSDSSGQTWTKAVGPNSVSSGPTDPCKIAIYYLLNANSGTHNLTLSVGSSQFFGYTLVEFPPCTAVDVTTSNSGTSGVTSGDTGTTGATAQANEAVLVGLVTNTSGAGLSNSAFSDPASSGFTSLFVEQNTTAHVGSQHSYKEVSATGAQTGSWTWSSGAQTSWMAVIATFKLTGGGSTPAISSTSSASPANGGSLTITGTNFGASQGSGSVTIGGVTQTVTSWSDTSITVTVSRGTNKYGAALNVVVTDNSANSSSPYALTGLTPQADWSYVDIGTPNTTAANRITSVPDLASGDQVAYTTQGGQVVVANDGTFSVSTGVRSFDFEVWTSPDGWGGQATQYVRADVADTRLKKQRMRSSVMRWMYSGAGGEKFTQRGWFSRDIVLPISAASGTHTTTGALAAQSATIAGSATHLLLHTTTGALSAQAATISGAAQHQHAATGALAAQAATVAGSAAHLTLHATTGALSAQSSTIAGAAAHQHAATGALQAQSATIAGSADHTAAGSSHSTSGALSAQAATIAGSATHLTLHTTTGALSAQSATIAGAALHPHTTSGALQAQSATLAGTAAHATLHTTGGALSAQAATLSGAAAHEHASAGALAAQSATIAGTAVHAAAGVHIATGALQAGDASISGSAAAPIQRQVLGGWAKYRRQDRQERPDDEESTKTPQPNDTPVVEAVAPKQRIRGRIRIADIAARLAEQQQADADKLERQAVERARRKRRQQQEEELLLF